MTRALSAGLQVVVGLGCSAPPAANTPERAAGVSAAEIDTLFVSPRNGQPYDVRYNDPPPPEGPQGPLAVVVERVGKGGMRFVAYSTGKIE